MKMLSRAEELDNVKNSYTTAQGTIAELQEQLKAAEHGFATALVGRLSAFKDLWLSSALDRLARRLKKRQTALPSRS